jgi:hypothetical protein
MSPSANQAHPEHIEGEVKIKDGRHITFDLSNYEKGILDQGLTFAMNTRLVISSLPSSGKYGQASSLIQVLQISVIPPWMGTMPLPRTG